MSNKIFYDFEFQENGREIKPISLGMVKESGENLYIQFLNFRVSDCNEWVRDNVLPHLYRCPKASVDPLHYEMYQHAVQKCDEVDCPWMKTRDVPEAIKAFVGDELPTWYGWYSAYDHVALCQLFGSMSELPQGYPMWTFDLKQWHVMLGSPLLPQQEGVIHNALEDAKENLKRFEFLRDYSTYGLHRIVEQQKEAQE